MLSNELKKGMRVKLKNGWYATVMDNKKGNIRLMEVDGDFTEIGSVYVWDIDYAIIDGVGYQPVTLTEKQINARNAINKLLGIWG